MLDPMAAAFPNDAAQHMADVWRRKFYDAYRLYAENPTAENRAIVMKTLRTFADPVIRGRLPSDSDSRLQSLSADSGTQDVV
jgi:hypothetical protein